MLNEVHQYTFRPVTTENWRDLETFFESRGGPHSCWCMVWRKMNAGGSRSNKVDKKASFKSYVDSKTPVGLLCYDGDKPIAWCSIAPRESYRSLDGNTDIEGVWSLVCFFVSRPYRNQGLMERLILEAVSYAKQNGAKYVEAYPVDPDSPSYKFMGLRPVFEVLGFTFTHDAGARRHVMLLAC